MIRIGLLSDTHSFLHSKILEYFAGCDEVWHAGDIGDISILDTLEAFKPVKAVYGNIDDAQIRSAIPKDLRFEMEGVDVFITHIGGYPGRYNRRIKAIMESDPPDLFICGHSHILKIMFDKKYECLHINPGACGNHGFHKIRTIVRFSLHQGRIQDLEYIELGQRGEK